MAGPAAQEPPAGAAPAHQPYIPDGATIPEFTWPALLVGAVLGIIFGASSLYLVLKVGMTVSASIPVAVLSITLFRVFTKVLGTRRATILENNIVQTAGSAGESIAFGIGVTMPALLLLGFEMDPLRVMVVGVLGGLLGILMMIPLRRAFVVKQHGTLRYPEGTACAEVLIAGEKGGTTAKTVFTGFGIAFVYQLLMQGLRLWKEAPAKAIAALPGAEPAITVDPTMLGVGYIIGTKISCIMLAGAVLSYMVLVPAIRFFGDGLTQILLPGQKLIRNMSAEEIRSAYILYIGAGAVAAGGIISLCRAVPLILSSIAVGLRDLGGSKGGQLATRRTDRDLSLRVVFFGSLALMVAIWAALPLGSPWSLVGLAGAVLVVLFGFLFVTVSSRLTGEIGSSSNPISGMTIATLILTCLIFLALGWTGTGDRLIAMTVAAVVCVASSNGGTTSQDLKTGFLVGATPRYQQWAIVIGAVTSALVLGFILLLLNRSSTIYSKKDLPTPAHPIDVSRLTDLEKAPGDPTAYHAYRVSQAEAERQQIPRGKYLVDDAGRIRYLVDPGIMGVLTHDDHGNQVRKYAAPQTELMALITDGILARKLPWTLVVLGALIAVVLELSQVPSLPFAVGVYLRFNISAPVFVGGMIRLLVDRWGPRPDTSLDPEAASETSPGALLATGYIAGGALGGMLVAFLAFSDTIPNTLARWQFRERAISVAKPLEGEYEDVAARELGLSERARRGNQALKGMVAEMKDINAAMLPPYTEVPAGAKVNLPEDKTFVTPRRMTLGELAARETGGKENASILLDLNDKQLKLPDRLPAGTMVKIPQRNAPALAVFAALAAVLALVGLGWIMKAKSTPPDGS
ncbi:MAG: OPT family oligopeptide transporter [Thermoguttaceae bacterium]